MIRFRQILPFVLFGLTILGCGPTPVVSEASHKSRSFGILDISALEHAKARIADKDPLFLKAYDLLEREAQQALQMVPPSVLDKSSLPPSGDKHDYTSMGPYWWPNPDTPDGLPYIRRDGEVNPERNAFDKLPGAIMSEAVTALALMYYFSEELRYADKAALFLRTWFLDPATRMNPHLRFGQFIPGSSQGRSVGIIESRNFVFLTDYEPLLRSAASWPESDQLQFKVWMTNYLNWLVESDLGQQEGRHSNNHGSWYDYQVLALSQYCQQPEPGQRILEHFSKKRIQSQIMADGSQPEELARTKSFSYSGFNLMALCSVLRLAENDPASADLLTSALPIIDKAAGYLTPVIQDSTYWNHDQITGFDGVMERLIPALCFIGTRSPENKFQSELALLLERYPKSRFILTTDLVRRTTAADGPN